MKITISEFGDIGTKATLVGKLDIAGAAVIPLLRRTMMISCQFCDNPSGALTSLLANVAARQGATA